MARRRNPYLGNLTQDLSGINTVYQPIYDPSETSRYADVLLRSQQGYDQARQSMADFNATAGGMHTTSPDMLNQRLDEFTGGAQQMVDEQYGGDWNAAKSDLSDMIAEEKANPLYKAIDYQNKQIEEMRQAQGRKRGVGEKLLVTGDPTRNLSEIDMNNYMNELQYQGVEIPNYDKVTSDIVSRVKPDAIAGMTSLSDNEKQLLLNNEISPQQLLVQFSQSGNSKKLAELEGALTNSVYSQLAEPLEAEFGENAYNQANTFVKNMIPQLSQNKTSRKIDPRFVQSKEELENEVPKTFDYTPIARNKFIDEKSQAKYRDLFGFLKEHSIDLNQPELNPKMASNGKVKNKAINAAFWAEENLAEASKSIENFGEYIPTFSKIYDKLGLELPKWIETAAKYEGTTGSLLGMKAQMADLTAKGASAGASGVGKAYGSLAKYMSGAGETEDAYNVIEEYEKINGQIDSKDFNEKFDIAAQSMLNGTMVENKILSLPTGRNENEGGNLKYNSKTATDKLQSGAGVYDRSFKIYKDGKLTDVSAEKLKEELDLPKDIGYQDFDVVGFDPKSGNLIAETADKEGKMYSYQITDSQLRKDTKEVRKSFNDIKSKGYTLQNLGNDVYLVGYNQLQTNPVDGTKMSVPVLRQVNKDELGGNISLNSIKENFQSGTGSKIYTLEDYSKELLRSLNAN